MTPIQTPSLSPLARYVLWGVLTGVLVAAVAYLRLVVYPGDVVPLSYGIPMMICLIHRDLRLHWAMVLSSLIIVIVKETFLAEGTRLDPSTHLVFNGMQVVNVLVPGLVFHLIVTVTRKLHDTVARLGDANAELEASNEELATREEEISQQNEELQSQTEEMEQQTEELASQTEGLQSLNEQLAARERTLGDLVEVSLGGATEPETLERLGQAITKLFAPRAAGAAVLEPGGTDMHALALFGLTAASTTLRRDRTLADLVVSRDRAGFLADALMRPDLDMPRLADGSRARSVLAAPLRAGPSASGIGHGGALEIYSTQPGDWSEQELRLVQWAAEQVGRTWSTTRLRQELDSQGRLLRTVTDSSSVALFMLDDKGCCTYANPAALAMTGFSDEELIAKPLQDHLRPVQTGESAAWPSGEFTLRRKGGQEFPAACLGTPVHRDAGAVGTVIEVRDIAEQKRVAAEREQLLVSERAARAAADHASRAKDEFVATLSHELRTPLNAVLGWATILRRGKGDPESVAKGMEVIERNARLQAQLIADLLDMSKIVAGKVRLEVQAVDLVTVIESALDVVRPNAETKGVRIEALLEPVDRMVSGDPSRLQQVVWNLLINAVKFTPRGGAVRVMLSRVASYVQIVVSDSGQGISEGVLPHIFDRYRQGDSSTSRHQGGLGLGLAIVKHLTELHGGTVYARSDGPGRGATFSVLLPVSAVEAAAPVRGAPHPATPTVPPVDDASPSLAGLLVLVVDDDADAREVVRRVLADAGAAVVAAGNADEGLAALRDGRFDLLVSDVGMPGMDGYTFIQRVRGELGRVPGELPAIALTAFARSEDRTRALLAGFQSHMSKPVEATELIATVASLRPAVGRESAPA